MSARVTHRSSKRRTRPPSPAADERRDPETDHPDPARDRARLHEDPPETAELGIRISRQTITNVLATAGLAPDPTAGPNTGGRVSETASRHAVTVRLLLEADVDDQANRRRVSARVPARRQPADEGITLHRALGRCVGQTAGPHRPGDLLSLCRTSRSSSDRSSSAISRTY